MGVVKGIVDRYRVKKLNLKKALKNKHFRVSIFGSARLKPGDSIYEDVFDLAEHIGSRGYDVVTGGGPGLMEAANAGHMAGDRRNRADSIGLVIHLPFESAGNKHLEIRRRFMHFSDRLDTFLALSHVMIVTTGGIGSLLELYYMWQHMQVHHVAYKPIILVGKMWRDLIIWMKEDVLTGGLVSPADFDYIYIANDNDQAMAMIDTFHKLYRKEKKLRQIVCHKAICAIPGVQLTGKIKGHLEQATRKKLERALANKAAKKKKPAVKKRKAVKSKVVRKKAAPKKKVAAKKKVSIGKLVGKKKKR
jgi:predicted Rossmann-fold nucleotide-binding protein